MASTHNNIMQKEHILQLPPGPWGVLLLAHGAPDKLEVIPEFLLNVREGRPLPEPAVKEIVRRYSLIGGGSPLLRLTTLQAEALAKLIAHPVYVGMRNWKPFIPEAVRRLCDDGARRVVAVCLAPQNSRTSIGLYRKYLTGAVEQVRPGLVVDFIESWHDHPGLIEAFRERAAAALLAARDETGGQVPVIFTAHSVPERTIADGDPYERQVRETAALVAGAVGLTEYRLAFQSQGMTADKWIGPTVESQIDELAQAGGKSVLLVPVGFVSDHVEILYDIDVLFRDYGKARGVSVRRSESLNASPKFAAALASLVTARVEQLPRPPGTPS
ncbi:MAG TPA: ferrochelatase [Terriglobia bacterium]|nr:ferrochelatase [Terriglobia bacterium]